MFVICVSIKIDGDDSGAKIGKFCEFTKFFRHFYLEVILFGRTLLSKKFRTTAMSAIMVTYQRNVDIVYNYVVKLAEELPEDTTELYIVFLTANGTLSHSPSFLPSIMTKDGKSARDGTKV